MKKSVQQNCIKQMAFATGILPFVIALFFISSCGRDSSPEDSDVTPPAEITNLNGIVGNAQVTLNWTDPADEDFERVEITVSPGNNTVQVDKGVQTAVIGNLTNGTAYDFTLRTVDVSGNVSEGINAGPYTPEPSVAPAVYMTTRITSEGLMAVYGALGRKPAAGQKVAVKITTGEGASSNHLRPDLIRTLVQSVNGDLVESNTAYGGRRASTAVHYQTAADHGYTAVATVVIMDESATMDIPVRNGERLNINRVGSRFADYQSHIVLGMKHFILYFTFTVMFALMILKY
jgi:hypothetical protein